MKKTMINSTHVEGYVYEHKLEQRVAGPQSKNPGTNYITGTVSIATDDALMNVINVHYTYVTETTKNGSANATYSVLKNIIDGKICNVVAHGKDKAGMIRIDSAIDLNEFYDTKNDNQLVSVKRNEGGFAHLTSTLADNEKTRATFTADMIITNVVEVAGDEEKNTQDKVVVKGAIFNFRKDLLPVEFSVVDPAGMSYFLSLDASPKTPVFTKVWGQQVSQTLTRTYSQESAFGEASVREVKSSRRDFVITGASPVPYEWDSEESILASELSEAVAQREIHLAEIKKRQDDYNNSKAAPIAAQPAGSSEYVF